MLLGWKVFEAGAEPGGRVLALNSGAASLPTRTPGLCYRGSVCVPFRSEIWGFGGCLRPGFLTPCVVRGSSRGLEGWNSPCAFSIESALRAAMLALLRTGDLIWWVSKL